METNNGIITEYVLNKNGVRIKKCCASCKYHEPLDSDGPRRICVYLKRNKAVKKDDVCGDWSISDMIDGIKVRGHGA